MTTDSEKKKCFNCGRTNHLTKDCRDPPRNSGQSSSGTTSNAAFSAVAFRADSSKKRVWYIDSDGSRHMTQDEKLVSNKTDSDVDFITCANDSNMVAERVNIEKSL